MRRAPAMLVETPELLYAEVPGTEWSPLVEMADPGAA
jgi:hypothetical protein